MVDDKTKKDILQRITSPWFFTFIPWWVVFNYDFLILVFGKVETLNAVRTYYKCDFINKKLSIFGCIDFYGWGNNQFFWKLLFPVIATVVSMIVIAYVISWVQDKYNSIMEKDYWWKKREERLFGDIDELNEKLSHELHKDIDIRWYIRKASTYKLIKPNQNIYKVLREEELKNKKTN